MNEAGLTFLFASILAILSSRRYAFTVFYVFHFVNLKIKKYSEDSHNGIKCQKINSNFRTRHYLNLMIGLKSGPPPPVA